MQLLRYADLHCHPLCYSGADRRQTRMAIRDDNLGSAVLRQRRHQASQHGFLGHVHGLPTCSFRIGSHRLFGTVAEVGGGLE